MHRWLSIATVSTLAVTMTACASDDGTGGEDDAPLVIALDAEPDNLNPIFGDIYGTIYGDKWPIFSGLVGYDQQRAPVPDLAAELPEIDGTTVRVSLRDDASFHDGEPVTAQDVVFTYESILDPDVATRLRDLLFDSLERVEAVDETTVEFHLSRPDPAFLDKLYIGIVPEHLLAGEDLNTTGFNTNPVGSGPFQFDQWYRGERIVLSRHDSWHGGDVASAQLVFSFIPDDNARASQLTSGAIDAEASSLPASIADTFDDDAEFDVVGIPGDALALLLPETNPLFADSRTRQAIGYALDREAIVDGVFRGRAEPVHTPLPPGHWAAHESLTTAHEPQQAQQLLADAGWREDGDTLVDEDGSPLAFELAYAAGSASDRNAALAIEDQLGAVGIDVELVSAGHDQQADRVANAHPVLTSTGTVFDPDLDFVANFHSSRIDNGAPFDNPVRIDDPELDDALEDARATYDRDARADAYARVQERVAAHGGWQFLVRPQHLFVVSDRVEGVDPRAGEGHLHGFSRGLLWNLHEWRVD